MADATSAPGATKDTPPRAVALSIDVALAPSLLPPAGYPAIYIVVDVIRATTTLSVLFDHGCQEARIVRTVAEARETRTRGDVGFLAGEEGGLRPDGFDLGNSPREAASAPVGGQAVIFATTNGTRALHACASPSATAIFAGSFRNASAVAEAAVTSYLQALRDRAAHALPSPSMQRHEHAEDVAHIVVVCAGLGGRPALDDTLCAGHLAEQVASVAAARGVRSRLLQGARIAALALRGVGSLSTLAEVLSTTPAARKLDSVGLGADLAWCAQIDTSRSVPAVVMPIEHGEPLIMRAATAD